MSTTFYNHGLAVAANLRQAGLVASQKTKIVLLVLLVTAGYLKSLGQSDTWTQKNDFGYNAMDVSEPASRVFGACFSIGGKGYMGTGSGFNGSFLKDFWEFDPVANTWNQKADFAGSGRSSAVGFSIGSKGYMGTGYYWDGDNHYVKDFWQYDPAANTWNQKADFAGSGRFSAVGFSIGSKGYIGTGSDGSSNRKDFWEYDPASDSWKQKADFGGAERDGAAGFVIGCKGYIGTGSAGDFSYDFNDFWEYDPVLNNWTQKADFGGAARNSAVGFNISNKGYIGTGGAFIFSSGTNDFWEYDPTINVWIPIEDFPVLTRGALGFNIGNNGYVGAGRNVTDFQEYNPVKDMWTRKAGFGGIARHAAVAFSINGKGYIGTGAYYDLILTGSNHYCKDFWEYDPIDNTWAQKADFGGTARSDAVGFSIGSKGYIGTGYSEYSDYSNKKDFWEYDPITNVWKQKADFGGTARSLAVGFSIGSKGFIGTGFDENTSQKDLWQYDVSTDTWMQKADFTGSARTRAVGFSIGSKGYIGTGFDENYSLKKDFGNMIQIKMCGHRKQSLTELLDPVL
jgi:hypothetical protein